MKCTIQYRMLRTYCSIDLLCNLCIDASFLCNQKNFVIDLDLGQLVFFWRILQKLKISFQKPSYCLNFGGMIVLQCNRNKIYVPGLLNTVVEIFCNHCQQSHILSHFRSLYISYFHIVIVESWYRLVHFVQKCLDSRSLKEDINTFLTIIWWKLHFIMYVHIMSI